MFKLLLALITISSSFGVYEFEKAAEKEKAQREVTNLIIQEEFEKECFIKVKESVATIIKEETEELFDRKNIKLIMGEFFQRKEFEEFEKKNQQTNEDILSRLRDLEERDRLRNEELLDLRKDNERKNETILNLQNKVNTLENELFKKFDVFSDEILEKVVPVKEDDEELFNEFNRKVIASNGGDYHRLLPVYARELLATKIVSKIKNKERLEFLSDTYDKLFPLPTPEKKLHAGMNYIGNEENKIRLKTLGVCALNKVNPNNMDKFCQFVDYINSFNQGRKPGTCHWSTDIINPDNIGVICEFEIEKLDIIRVIFDKIQDPRNWNYYNAMRINVEGFNETFEQLILLAKHSTIDDLKKIESELPQKNIRNFTDIIRSFK